MTLLVVDHLLSVPLDEIRFSFARSSGPGGQNVNKVNTKAVLRWSVVDNRSLPEAVRERFIQAYQSRLTKEGELVLHGERYRDAPKNRDDCLSRLRAMLAAVAAAPKRRRPTKPTRGAVHRRLADKTKQSEKKRQRGTRDFD